MRRSGPTFQKREKEKARKLKRMDKLAKRTEAKERRANQVSGDQDEDPDIAGIRPGPQPLPAEWRYAPGNSDLAEGQDQ